MSSEIIDTDSNYAAVQFQSNIYEPQNSYLVISTKWIVKKKEEICFYWPNKNLVRNRTAVKNCDRPDSSWILAKIRKIIMYSGKYY